MWRFLAGAAACFLMMSGAFLMWQGRAQESGQLPPPPPPSLAAPAMVAQQPLQAPEATPKTREEKRFNRADKNDDGRIVAEELLQPRRKAYAKLDKNGDGRLSFEEWAVKTIDKFEAADADRNKQLSRAEYATTAPKPSKKPKCRC